MTTWQRLSVRDGRQSPVELTESFSAPATIALLHWLEGVFGYRDARVGVNEKFVLDVALAVGVTINRSGTRVSSMRRLLESAQRDDNQMLDVLDAVLHVRNLSSATVNSLRETLRDAFSIWTVADSDKALERRVSATLQRSYRQVVADHDDDITLNLEEAWAQLYGITPNYSDAWDHAIKAMEAALVPIVAPNNRRATLGVVITELQKELSGVVFSLGPQADLSRTLRFAWPNPDRHSGGQQRPPSAREAAGVVHLAITVAEWQRNGVIQAA